MFFGSAVAFDAFLLWHLILTQPRQVSLTRETVELRPYVGKKSIPIASIDAATSDPIGQAQLLHAGEKSRLGLAGPELQRFLSALRERKPDVRVKGLAAS